jgi:CxxC motif-containing protein (DUF1111 family)
LLYGCADDEPVGDEHGPIAEGISAPLGDPIPESSEEHLEAFERGEAVALRRFSRDAGLGPAFNVTFCAACHERPTPGGSAGLYRNFFIAGTRLEDGSFVAAQSAGEAAGVVRYYYYGDEEFARPAITETANVYAQRNPIPFFGVGLLAELSDEEILSREDPDDSNGDGISGRANYDRGFVGRFGRKSQTVSIEGFIRGPLFNHLGITTDPLSEEQKAALPVDSSGGGTAQMAQPGPRFRQAAAPETSLVDEDGVDDPELSSDDLFDLVSYAMLLAAPELEELSEQGERGRAQFNALGCGDCHAPRLDGPRGPLPVYSDLLLHDMGAELADGLSPGLASGSEFRTQPLWGIAAVGPYLHDGRAETLEDAISMHGGEGRASRDAAAEISEDEMADLVEFLLSLGGRSQYSPGLLPPATPLESVGALGGPRRDLDAMELERFESGRALFDREFGRKGGVGSPRMNGDSCRACHFDPIIGGAGPNGVNVMRHGILSEAGEFVPPLVGTILHKGIALDNHATLPQVQSDIFEHRQTPPLFGLGLMDGIDEATILANADPDDALSPDGITGRVSWSDGDRVGRFGWKAQVPSVEEFVRDALGTELGLTLPYVEGLTFGKVHDNDEVADPELGLDEADELMFYLLELAPPPRTGDLESVAVQEGESLFTEFACASCHIPELEGADGGVALYSDLLLHEVLPGGGIGIEENSASMLEFRTAPLWGLAYSGPYMHDGAAQTVAEAIAAHDGEASGARDSFATASEGEREALLAFLATL